LHLALPAPGRLMRVLGAIVASSAAFKTFGSSAEILAPIRGILAVDSPPHYSISGKIMG
jgi:hypothetical protein